MVPEDAGVAQEREAELVRELKAKYDQAKKDKKRFSDKWGLYWKLALGKHWPEGRTGDMERARPVIQKTHQAIETRLAHLTNRRPATRLFVAGDAGVAPAEAFQRIYDAKMDDAKIDFLTAMSIRNVEVVGVGCLFVGHKIGKDGMPDCDIQIKDPHHVFLAPGCLDEADADYILVAQNMTLGQVKRQFTDLEGIDEKLARVTPGVMDDELFVDVLADPSNEGMTHSVSVTDSSGNVRGPYHASSENMRRDAAAFVTLLDAWIREPEGELRRVISCNDVILYEGPTPYLDNDFPFVFFRKAPSSITFWSQGTVQQVCGIQLLINKLMAQVLDILAKTGAPILLLPSEAGIDPKSIKMKPGLILTYNAGEGTRPEWLQPNPLPNGIFESISYLSDQIDKITGNTEIMSGGAPGGIEAARAIEALASQASVRIEREAAFLKMAYQRLAQLVVSRIKQFYGGVERKIPTVGHDGAMGIYGINQPQFAEGQSAIGNELSGDEEILVQVDVSQSLPAVRLAEYQKTIGVAQLGAFGPPMLPNGMVNQIWQREILRAAEYAGYKQIQVEVQQVVAQATMQAIQMQQAMAAQAQQAQAQAGPPPQQKLE